MGTPQSVVYFAKCESFIKIGTTTNLKERIGVLATSSPFPIACLGTLPGDKELEGWLHGRFESHRAMREWFHHRGSVAAFVKEVVLRKGKLKQRAIENWRGDRPCERCGGRVRYLNVEVVPGVPWVALCRSCDTAWPCESPHESTHPVPHASMQPCNLSRGGGGLCRLDRNPQHEQYRCGEREDHGRNHPSNGGGDDSK